MKRLFDIALSLGVLLIFSPVILVFSILVWLQDFKSPFYMAPRVGKNGKEFRMVKLRSMVANADKTGVNSTSARDSRITPLGHVIRRYKLDELTQLWNVLKGEMSVVGPRPQVKTDADLYTPVETGLLTVRPGITDMASIVFSDEGDILQDSKDPDLDYNQLIRPWKSRLGLLYVEKSSIMLDMRLISLTIFVVLSRERALREIQWVLAGLNAEEELRRVALRREKLVPTPPPGSSQEKPEKQNERERPKCKI